MPIQGGPHDEGLDRNDIEAALETRRELGLRYDAELVDGFADRIERGGRAGGSRTSSAARRDADRSRSAAGPAPARAGDRLDGGRHPDLAIALAAGRRVGTPCRCSSSLGGLVGVNVAHAWQSKR